MGGVRVLQLDETPPHGSQTNQAGPEQHQAARLRSRLAIGHQNHILFVVRVDGVVESNEGQSRRDVAVTEIKQNIVPRVIPRSIRPCRLTGSMRLPNPWFGSPRYRNAASSSVAGPDSEAVPLLLK